jgi:hypothetical protein
MRAGGDLPQQHKLIHSIMGRHVARRLCFDDSPASYSAMVLFEPSEHFNDETLRVQTTIVVKRARSGRKDHVQVTTAHF